MSELKVERKENMCGGEGHILINKSPLPYRRWNGGYGSLFSGRWRWQEKVPR